MKTRKLHIAKFALAWLTAIMILLPACDNEALLDLNENPNASSEIDLSYLLAFGTLQIAGDRYENWRGNLIYCSTMIQQNAHLATYWSGDKYLYNAGYDAALWDRNYGDALKTITRVVDETQDVPGSENLHAAAVVMRAFTLQRLSDIYGDVPYLQAGRGLEGEENWFPAYESQEVVYQHLVTDLRTARDMFDPSGDNLGVQDIIYGGDVSNWKRWANSLLIRVGMRMSNVDPSTAQSVVEEAANNAAGVIETMDQSAYFMHVDGVGFNQNGNSKVFQPGNGGEYASARPSQTLIDWLKSNNDPRLMIISGGTGNPLDPGTWDTNPADQEGLPNGYDAETIVEKAVDDGVIPNEAAYSINIYSFLNPKLYNYDDPTFFQTHAEVALLLAEASLKGWNVGSKSATEYFEEGVRAAVNNWVAYDASLSVPSGTTDSYIAGLGFDGASDDMKYQLIGEQYWAATYFNHYEAYSNWRRTGYPVLQPTNYSGNVTGGEIPRRLRYPESEAAANPENYSNAIAQQGPDEFLTRVWWDVE